MSQTLQHQVKPSTDVSLPVQSEPQLQRRAFPHEVESQTDKAIASTKPISADWQAQQEKIARARFNPGMISLYPANPLKDEKEKPVQRKVDSIVESDETQTKPIQRRVESPPEADEGQAESIQRKTESTAQDELEKDKPSSNKLVQTKLSVGKVGDRYEQEADQVAAKVMTMPDPSQNRIQRNTEQPESEIQPKPMAITPLVQRQSTDEEVQPKSAPNKQAHPKFDLEARLASSKAGGSPLPDQVRSFMEPRFGVSLKHVQVHTDADATQMNKELRAQAFAYRNHIYYAAGKSPAKDELTAHELTHVIQQTGAKQLNEGMVRRSPESDNQEPIQAKSLESSSTDIANNKLTPAESSIQRHDISLISPQIQRNPLGLLGDVVTGDLEGARRSLLDSVAGFASGMPGYPLLTVILGKDPIKDQPVERNATNLVRGVLSLVPGGDRLFQNLQESGALQKAFDWFDQQIRLLNLTWDTIKTLFRRAIDSLSPSDIFNPVGAIERLVNIFRDPINRIIRFALNVGQKVMEFVFEGAMALAGKGGADRVMGILRKVGGLFMKIVKDPIGFVGNLVRSVKGGFENFSTNIMTHLKAGLMGWLFGALSGSGLQMPATFNLKGMLSIALQVVGATYQTLRKKLVKRMGEKKVSQTEKSFALLRSIASGGLIAAWKQISQSTGDVKEMVISEVRNWVITTIIKKAVIKLVSMFNPAGAIVQAVIAVYNTVMFFIERMQQIIELAQAVFNSINSIAAGKIGAAIKFVEQSMAKSLPVIISFMARLLGLGGISNKIRNVIKKMQKPIDRAMNKIINKVMEFASKLFGKGKKGKGSKDENRTMEQKLAALKKAIRESEQLMEGENNLPISVKKKLPSIKSKYKLRSLKLVKNNDVEYHVEGEINPKMPGRKKRIGRSFSLAPGGLQSHEGDVLSSQGKKATQVHLFTKHSASVPPVYLLDRLEKTRQVFQQVRDRRLKLYTEQIDQRQKAANNIKHPPKDQDRYQDWLTGVERNLEEIKNLKIKRQKLANIKESNREAVKRFLAESHKELKALNYRKSDITFEATKFYNNKVMQKSIMNALKENQKKIDSFFMAQQNLKEGVTAVRPPIKHGLHATVGIGYELNSKMEAVPIGSLKKIVVIVVLTNIKNRHYKVETAYPTR